MTDSLLNTAHTGATEGVVLATVVHPSPTELIYHPTHGYLPWAADRAQDAGLLHVAALIRSAMGRIDALTAERDAYRDAPALRVDMDQSCTGCEREPTDTKPHYDSGCMECRRFYGDLYEGTSK